MGRRYSSARTVHARTRFAPQLCYRALGRTMTTPAAPRRALRITLIGPTPPLRGGIAHYTAALTRTLRTRHQIQLVGLRRQYPRRVFPGTTELDRSRVPVDCSPDEVVDPLAPWTWRSPLRAIAEFAPDVIVMAWWQPALGSVLATFAALARRRCAVPLALLCHNVSAHDATAMDRVLMRYGLHRGDAVIVHSGADAERARGIRPTVRVLRTRHPAYNLPEFGHAIDATTARARLGLAGDVLLFFGLIRRYKGLADAVRALPRILARHRCTLLVGGEFYEPRAPYDALVRELHLDAHVRIIDRYVPNEDVGVYFSAADMLLAPYRAATQSGVVALAQQFHRPAIVTRVGGLPDMIADGATGLVVPPDDPAALATAVLRVYEDGVDRWIERVRAAHVTTWAEEMDAIEQLVG
jgi:glycosyltransferase involved in cell wall biosynthesis